MTLITSFTGFGSLNLHVKTLGKVLSGYITNSYFDLITSTYSTKYISASISNL